MQRAAVFWVCRHIVSRRGRTGVTKRSSQNEQLTPTPDEDWNHLGRFLFGIDDEIADQFMPRYLVGAVARVLTPGCQLRQTPVLQGGQGIGKTELGRALFGHDFYGDGLTPALDIDEVTKLNYVWGMELDELNGMTRRTQVEKLKPSSAGGWFWCGANTPPAPSPSSGARRSGRPRTSPRCRTTPAAPKAGQANGHQMQQEEVMPLLRLWISLSI